MAKNQRVPRKQKVAKKQIVAKKQENRTIPLLFLLGLSFLVFVVFLMSQQSLNKSKDVMDTQNLYTSNTTITGDIEEDLKNIDAKIDSLNMDDFNAEGIDKLQQ